MEKLQFQITQQKAEFSELENQKSLLQISILQQKEQINLLNEEIKKGNNI